MSENTNIEWCDHTFNGWEGCQHAGPGCDNCYAEARNKRFGGGVAVNWGPGAPRRRTSAANWTLPLKWNRRAGIMQSAWANGVALHGGDEAACIAAGFFKPQRPKVFCSSLADVFDNAVDPMWRADLFALIAQTQNLDWLLLTKRIGNVKPMLEAIRHSSDEDLSLLDMMPMPNVWLGATIVNQAEADRDIPKLLAVPAEKRFLSMEPLLGPINIRDRIYRFHCGDCDHDFNCVDETVRPRLECPVCGNDQVEDNQADVDWVIVGGESGHNARPMHPDWARSLRDQCQSAGVPFMVKQWGEWREALEGEEFDTWLQWKKTHLLKPR